INGLALVTVQETQRRSGTRTLGASNTIPITPNLKEYHATSTNATPPAMPPPTPNPPQIQINQCPKLIMAVVPVAGSTQINTPPQTGPWPSQPSSSPAYGPSPAPSQSPDTTAVSNPDSSSNSNARS